MNSMHRILFYLINYDFNLQKQAEHRFSFLARNLFSASYFFGRNGFTALKDIYKVDHFFYNQLILNDAVKDQFNVNYFCRFYAFSTTQKNLTGSDRN